MTEESPASESLAVQPATMESTPASDETADKRTILFLGFHEDAIEHIKVPACLTSRARVVCATNPATAYAHLAAAVKPSVILIADSALSHLFTPKQHLHNFGTWGYDPVKVEEQKQYGTFLSDLNAWVRGGGTAVFCGTFSSNALLSDITELFSTAFGLPWKACYYHRSTFMLRARSLRRLNPAATLALLCSVKAVHLIDVEEKDRMYVPRSDSRIESFCFPPEPIDQNETPVAWADVGEGMVGYIGDINSEKEGEMVLLAMCGI